MPEVGVWEQADPGVTRKIHTPGKALMMMEVKFETGAVGAQHSHPHEQMSYCLEGKIEFALAGEKVILTKGETIVIPGGTEHGVVALEPSMVARYFYPFERGFTILKSAFDSPC